jgi:hypothetical protein
LRHKLSDVVQNFGALTPHVNEPEPPTRTPNCVDILDSQEAQVRRQTLEASGVPIRVEADREEQFSVQAAIMKVRFPRGASGGEPARETAWSSQSN